MSEDTAYAILDNWRAVHSFPMQVFYMRLKRTSESLDADSLVAQRLKRATSIIAKLTRPYSDREPTMQLSQMQDIGGCRAILSDVRLVQQLAQEEYIKKKGHLKHKLVNKKDYILEPKSDGYRGIHLIYRYKSDRKERYNGLLVEVQIRSKLQHAWATAVETVDFFTRQAIKSNKGKPEWKEFFRLVGSAFAKMEGCPPVPRTPTDEKELYLQILQKEEELSVIDKMKEWTKAMQRFDEEMKNTRAKFFLLQLDIEKRELNIHHYMQSEKQIAIDQYAILEKKYVGNNKFDVVFAGVAEARDLHKAYPNYYVDMTEFVKSLEHIIQNVR